MIDERQEQRIAGSAMECCSEIRVSAFTFALVATCGERQFPQCFSFCAGQFLSVRRIPLTKGIDLRLNLYNLNNAYYFDRLGGGHLIPGAGRSANISTTFRF